MKANEKELSFEENIKKLETIVRELESGDVMLDEKLKTATDMINKIVKSDGTLEEFEVEE